METGEYLFFMIVGSILVSLIILPPLIQIKQNITALFLKVYLPISTFLHNFISNPIAQIIFITLIFELIIYFFYRTISRLIQIRRNATYKRKERIKQIEKILNIDLSLLDHDALLNLSNKCKDLHTDFPKYKEEFHVILGRIKNRLAEEESIQNLREIEDKRDEAKEELKEINREIYVKKVRDEEKINRTIERLEIGYKEVFKKENLSANEREIAKQEGYQAVNEYCVLENKLIPVLVKPPLNHSPTHAFLVWSVKRLLKKFPKIERIREHETRNADITFKIKNKTYAIEIEKGSLMGKKRQLRRKIESLEDAYRDRWLILVSNKGLVKKYKEFGNVSTRKNLRNKIEKWIKNAENK